MSPLFHAVRPLLIDMAATLVFYGALAATGDVALATGVGIGLGVAQVAFMMARGRKIAPMQWTSLALVVVMGGATLLTHDARFILIKPTIIYAAIGAAMLQRGWMTRYMPPQAHGRIPEGYLMVAGYVWAALMFFSAALNLAVAFTLDARTAATTMAIWSTVSKIALFAAQYAIFHSVARRNVIAARQAAVEAA